MLSQHPAGGVAVCADSQSFPPASRDVQQLAWGVGQDRKPTVFSTSGPCRDPPSNISQPLLEGGHQLQKLFANMAY